MRRRVIYVQYTNPAGYPPLEHSSRILANAGWQVLFLGAGAQGADILEFPPHPNIKVRKLQFCPAGWRQKLHYFRFAFWTLFCVLRWRPKWIYASDPLSCPIALALTLLPGLRVIYHEHDSPTAGNQKSDHRSSISTFQRFVIWSRKKLSRRASLCVLPNEKRIEVFKEQTGTLRPVVCVWNCPRLEEAAAQEKVRSGKFVIFYHGSIVPARLPLAVVGALKHLPDTVILRIAGYETAGHRGYVETIKSEAARLGLAARIEYLGTTPRRVDLLAQCRKADVGLALMPMTSVDLNEQAMTGASNKPFDYLACGLALLVSGLPDWEKMFVESDCGLSCNPEDPASITGALRWCVDHPAETRQTGERGRERILNDWNYEEQFKPVFHCLQKD